MNQTNEEEFTAFQVCRDSGMDYIALLHREDVARTELIQARNRFMSARMRWYLQSVSINTFKSAVENRALAA